MFDNFQIKLILLEMKQIELYSYISDENKQYACDSHANMLHLFKKYLNQ